ncbi:hypothetical protein [Sorangium sp. So ce204]|uniref:hypothetical protein n=1 Tax=Sorangium sp. So ce204 TaxID=3133288 RepID=UPI003F617168
MPSLQGADEARRHGQAGADFFRDVFARPHTVSPDRLEQANVPVAIDEVESLKRFTDLAGREVELHVIETEHAQGMVVVYLPAEKLLFNADLFSPGGPINEKSAGELYDAITRLKLDVERIVGAHGAGAAGRVATLAALKEAAKR